MKAVYRNALYVVAGASVALLAVWISNTSHGKLAAPARTEAARPSSDVVRLPDDAPVLEMIRSQPLASMPLPLTDVLSARVVYDEDRTARVTTGFSGRIARLMASPGDAVRVGTPLAEIDSPDFGLATADLMKAHADEERKRLTLERSRDLLSGGVIPQKDVESAQADFAQARAETARAAQRVRNIDPGGSAPKGENFVLVSPMAGIVTERNANPAMEVNPNLLQPLFVISDLTHLWVLIDLPERLLGKVAIGAPVAIESDAFAGRVFSATVVHIAQVLDPGTRRIAVRARVDNAQLALRPEMFVRATLLRETDRGVRVPNEALVNEGLYAYVWVQTGDHAYRRVRVTPVIRGVDYSFIGDGLSGGERVVTSGALLLAAERHGGS
ncbi:MAG: efflux RND transporter periplasmic adaptor subunit [Burkholderiaceae bacterium]